MINYGYGKNSDSSSHDHRDCQFKCDKFDQCCMLMLAALHRSPDGGHDAVGTYSSRDARLFHAFTFARCCYPAIFSSIPSSGAAQSLQHCPFPHQLLAGYSERDQLHGGVADILERPERMSFSAVVLCLALMVHGHRIAAGEDS
jgi:hypothetical protein